MNIENFSKDFDYKMDIYLNGLKDGIVWDESIKSWMVFDFKTINMLLKNREAFSSNRLFHKKQLVALSEKHKMDDLILFYNSWLMYTDGEDHLKLKQPLQKLFNTILRDVTNWEYSGFNAEPSINTEFDIVREFIDPYVTSFQEFFLGIEKECFLELLNFMSCAVRILGECNISFDELLKVRKGFEKSKDIIYQLKNNGNYTENRFIDLFFRNFSIDINSISLLLNVIIDGVEPLSNLLACLSLEFFNKDLAFSNLNENDIKKFILEVLRIYPPFQYCGRTASININVGNNYIKKGDKIMFMIAAGNIDDGEFVCPMNLDITRLNVNNMLSFGVGHHICTGASLSKVVAYKFYNSLLNTYKNKKIKVLNSKFENSFGYRVLKSLVIYGVDK